MADRKLEFEDNPRIKRRRASPVALDPRNNPYLAHLYETTPKKNIRSNVNEYNSDDSEDGGVKVEQVMEKSAASQSSGFANFRRHATNTAMATKAENGPANPFNGKPLSKQYFDILKVRRGLPVHAQRYLFLPFAG